MTAGVAGVLAFLYTIAGGGMLPALWGSWLGMVATCVVVALATAGLVYWLLRAISARYGPGILRGTAGLR